jgi:hypothetical protein
VFKLRIIPIFVGVTEKNLPKPEGLPGLMGEIPRILLGIPKLHCLR